MIRRAAGFGLDVVLWSRRFAGERRPLTELEARELGVEAALRQVAIELAPTPEDVAARADILSMHLALGPETKGLVNARAARSGLRPGAILINTARGEVVDEAAVAAAVRDRGLRVGLDVFASEPSGADRGIRRSRCVAQPGVYGTHHIGASTEQAQEAIAAETVRIITTYKETGRVPNVVNLREATPATHMLVVRHRDRPGVLAHVFDQLRQRQPQRAGDREHRLRRGRGGGGAHQPRRRAVERAVRADQERQRQRVRSASGKSPTPRTG